ncbi:M18 family aminopeptidase [Streptomyces sp. NPDC047971]|uniref:M18 family aminopeptidase n=1 Tax=Streptomyces sp. NPDC047971 TaxID=3154499 RepID=UPI0033D6E039
MISYITASPSPYHAVAEAVIILEKAGFRELRETDPWNDAPGGRFLARGGTLIAWYTAPSVPAHAPFLIVASRTDAPNLRVAPAPDTSSVGWRQVRTEPYGSPALESWLDRDLGVSGRLALRDGTSRLVCSDEALLRVARTTGGTVSGVTPLWGLGGTERGALLDRLAEEGGVDYYEVLGGDLMLHDVQAPGFLGAEREFVTSARLDDLVSVHAGLTALTRAADGEPAHIPVLVAFDGGADGAPAHRTAALLERTLRRAVAARGGGHEDWCRALGGALAVHTRMVPAVHPDRPDRHDPEHRPLPNGGPVVTVGADGRGGTDGPGHALFAAACERAGAPWQTYVRGPRSDEPSGAGPSIGAALGIPSIEAGVAGLAGGTPRELCGTDDPWLLARVLLELAPTPAPHRTPPPPTRSPDLTESNG